MLPDRVRQLLGERGPPAGCRYDPGDFFESLTMAGVEECFLVGEIVVQRGLADAELLRDVVERGRVIALGAEGAQRRMEDLDAPPLALGAHVGGAAGRWVRVCSGCCSGHAGASGGSPAGKLNSNSKIYREVSMKIDTHTGRQYASRLISRIS